MAYYIVSIVIQEWTIPDQTKPNNNSAKMILKIEYYS